MTALKTLGCVIISHTQTGKRSFSKLNLIKTCHRSSMTQDRLYALAKRVTKYDMQEKMVIQYVLTGFATHKIRKVNLVSASIYSFLLFCII